MFELFTLFFFVAFFSVLALIITQVVRGWDLLGSAPRQMYLQKLFGFSHPQYGHVPMLVAPDGRRLSKRDRDMDLGQLQSRMTAEQLIGKLAFAANLTKTDDAICAKELATVFDWENLRKDEICLRL